MTTLVSLFHSLLTYTSPGSSGSPRNDSDSVEDDYDDDDVVSHHSSEGNNEEDDDALDDDADDADDGNPRKGTRPKVPWGPEILRHGWTNVEKGFHYYSGTACNASCH
jgi:hypothetical protein